MLCLLSTKSKKQECFILHLKSNFTVLLFKIMRAWFDANLIYIFSPFPGVRPMRVILGQFTGSPPAAPWPSGGWAAGHIFSFSRAVNEGSWWFHNHEEAPY